VNIKLSSISNSFTGRINIGGSKSISNRLLIVKGLAGDSTDISNLSDSDDTLRLSEYLKRIKSCEQSGVAMIIDVGNAGTVARFLATYLAFREGTWLITGSERMMKRPMKELVDGLIHLGAKISYQKKEGYLPIKITGNELSGKEVDVDVTRSSQFISALMLIGPYFEEGLKINFIGKPVSMPYIIMTAELMKKFGAKLELTTDGVKIDYKEYDYYPAEVEPDWSSASYWYELVALSENGEIFLPDFQKNSLQGDSILKDIFNELGVITRYSKEGIQLSKSTKITDHFIYDFSGTPDIVPAVMVTCAALGIDSEFKNIGQLAFKESDRIEALKNELEKIGASLVKKNNSYLLTTHNSKSNNLFFNTYNDHRMAMCFAPLVMRFNEIEIENHEIVNKSYPTYWNDFKNLNFAHLKMQTT